MTEDLQASAGSQPPETLALALKILGNFDFSGRSCELNFEHV
jgi:hypothetical protein